MDVFDPPLSAPPRKRMWTWWRVAVAILGAALMLLFSPWTPWPRAALVVEHCAGDALARDLDALEADLEREHPALLERGFDDHERVEESILAACRIPPHHVRDFLRVNSELMSDIDAMRFTDVEPVSTLARFQAQREIARHCGDVEVLHEVAVLPAPDRGRYMQERCGLPVPMLGYAVALFLYLTDAGVDEATSLRAIEHYFGSPLTIPLEDLVDKLPVASACDNSMRGRIFVRLTREGVTLPTHDALPMSGAGLSSADTAELRGWLHTEVDREFSESSIEPGRDIVLIADADVPASAVAQVVASAPANTIKWIAAYDPASHSAVPRNRIASYPLQGAYERALQSNATTTADLLTAMDRELSADGADACDASW